MSRVTIVGPGGLGSTIAALLAHRTSCEVQIVSRPSAHIEAIRGKGLRLCGLDECTVQIDATDDPGSRVTTPIANALLRSKSKTDPPNGASAVMLPLVGSSRNVASPRCRTVSPPSKANS